MYMNHWAGGDGAWFINMPFWMPAMMLAILPLILVFILWSVVWKGLALWHAARRGEHWWFMALLVINTFGILEIIYLFFVAKLKFNELFSRHDHH